MLIARFFKAVSVSLIWISVIIVNQVRCDNVAGYSSPLLLDITSNNCGYDCAAFAVADFKLKILSSELRRNLGLDDTMYNAASLASIQQVFQKAHIDAVVLGGLDGPSLCALLENNQLAIVHLMARQGHFIAVKKAGPEYRVVSFPFDGLISKGDLVKALATRMSGYALILSRKVRLPQGIKQNQGESNSITKDNTATTMAEPVRDVDGADHISRAPTAYSAVQEKGSNIQYPSSVVAEPPSIYDSQVKAEATIKNIGKDTLEVLSIAGACSCFQGEQGPLTLNPGQEKILQLRFDRRHFSFTQGTSIAIRCTDKLLPVCLINIGPPISDFTSKNIPDLICIPQNATVTVTHSRKQLLSFLFLINKQYTSSTKILNVKNGEGSGIKYEVSYYAQDFYGQGYNVAELKVPVDALSRGNNLLRVETTHPRDKEIPLSIFVNKS